MAGSLRLKKNLFLLVSAKTILVHALPKGHPEKIVKVYAITDDQSNKTLA